MNYEIKIICIILIVLAVLYIVYQLINSIDDEDKLTIESFDNTPTPSDTPTPTLTNTPTPIPTLTNTPTPTPTLTNTPTPSDTPIPTLTNTPTPSDTPIPTLTNTPTPSDTPIPTLTNTPTPTPTLTNTPTPTIPLDYYNKLKTDLAGATEDEIQNLAVFIKQFDINTIQSYLPNVPPTIRGEISQLVKNYKNVQQESQDDSLEYYSASKKYETKIQDAKAELKKLNESFANTNLEAPVNFNNMLDFRAFREIYVN